MTAKDRQQLRPIVELGARIHLIALYSAFAVIAAVVFGTLSVHPF
jgi:hypothetical protein